MICESNETYKVDDKHMLKVQRLDGCGHEETGISNDCLRNSIYIPKPGE